MNLGVWMDIEKRMANKDLKLASLIAGLLASLLGLAGGLQEKKIFWS